ncbi:MAG: NAD(P)H-hydrate dehydratase [Endomicrobium sp.]|jgi:NAD(P)H-hydrate epimerase|nr:NAD(P)H-hydrate dehydratase [Endomicrobium sp.]
MEKKEIRDFILKLKRKPDSHKYNYGHILVIAGSETMPGAGILCCLGALRSGAGLVTYAVRDNFLSQAYAMSKPEIMFFVYKTALDVLGFVKSRKVTSIVIGPGLKADNSILCKFIKEIISAVDIPVVLDASGITCFNGVAGELKTANAKLIVTPHLGEFSKLLDIQSTVIKNDREKITADFAEANSLICVLKGSNTLVSCGKEKYENNTGTPAMATAGSGDVLSGIISSFVNVTDDIFEAVKFAVFIHGLAGEIAERDKGTAGVIASDIVENICYAIKQMIIGKDS